MIFTSHRDNLPYLPVDTESNFACFACLFDCLGECWSGPGDSAFFLEGHARPEQCADQCYNDCACSTRFCAGKNFTNAVYAISKH